MQPPVSDREASLEEVCFKLCVCNAVRDALEGEVLSVRFQQLLLKPSKRLVDFILEVPLSSSGSPQERFVPGNSRSFNW